MSFRAAASAKTTTPSACRAPLAPNDPRYPCPNWFKRLCQLLSWFWWLAVVVYVSGVTFNLLVLLLERGFAGLLELSALLAALVSDKVLPAVVNAYPHWVGTFMLACVIGWITLDVKHAPGSLCKPWHTLGTSSWSVLDRNHLPWPGTTTRWTDTIPICSAPHRDDTCHPLDRRPFGLKPG